MKRITPLIAVILALAGCQHEPDSRNTHGEKLNLTVKESGYIVSGDLIGVSMDSPLSYRNVKTTLADGKLTPLNPLYWPKDMPDSAVSFRAYYPYNETFNEGGKVVFTANPDQRADEDFKTSGLLAGETKASVSDPSIEFDLKPLMTKLVLYIRNDSGSEITDLTFTAYPSVYFNMDNNTVRLYGQKVDFHAHLSATSDDGVSAYEVIFAPQNTSISVTVNTAGGDYSAVLNAVNHFMSGKQYSNSRLLVLEAGHSSPYSFSVEEHDWTAEPEFIYKDPLGGGAELSEFTDPGVYKIAKDVAIPLRAFVGGADQTAVISRNSAFSQWRLLNPSTGEFFALSTSSAQINENDTFDISVLSYGINNIESNFTSKATVVKTDGDIVWLIDENEKYGYIITVK